MNDYHNNDHNTKTVHKMLYVFSGIFMFYLHSLHVFLNVTVSQLSDRC